MRSLCLPVPGHMRRGHGRCFGGDIQTRSVVAKILQEGVRKEALPGCQAVDPEILAPENDFTASEFKGESAQAPGNHVQKDEL